MDTNQPEDSELMLATANGNPNAFDELIQRHQDGVYAFLRHMGMNQSAAEDITQEVFIKVFRNAGSYQPTAQFTTYLFKVVRNCRVDYLRRQSRQVNTIELSEVLMQRSDDCSEFGSELEHQELREVLLEELQKLPEKSRETLILSQTEGLNYDDIARMQGIPKGTVKSRVFSAINSLRERLARRKVL